MMQSLSIILGVMTLLLSVGIWPWFRPTGIPGIRTRGVLPYPSRQHARARADQRRAWLSEQLSRLEPGQLPNREVLESPPGFDAPIQPRSLSEDARAAIAQMARLKWQLRSDASLLAERVVDALLALHRLGKKEGVDPDFDVFIEPITDFFEKRDRFAWKVVVRSESSSVVKQLQGLSDWLGIGIDWVRGYPQRPHGRCTTDGGSEGVVGGTAVERRTGARFLVTCEHVLAADCQSRVLHKPRQSDGPDAALLHEGNPCFSLPTDLQVSVTAMSEQVVDSLIRFRGRVRHNNASRGSHAGRIVSRGVTLTLDGDFQRFPHCAILPWRTSYLFGALKLPIGARFFSEPGDSGSWIFDSDDNWVGMVLGGRRKQSLSYALLAEPLVDFMSGVLKEAGVSWDPMLETWSYFRD